MTVGETNHFIPLVMVPQDECVFAQACAGSGDATIHRVVWHRKIIVQRTRLRRGFRLASILRVRRV